MGNGHGLRKKKQPVMLKLPGGSAENQFPSPLSAQRGDVSRKVQLPPAHSLMDWIRKADKEDVQGEGGKLREVTQEELARHNHVDDCWTALRGNVYNVTKYMDFHPGGVFQLMRGAGIDATELFDEVHKWVNYSAMLKNCLIGPLKRTPQLTLKRAPQLSVGNLQVGAPVPIPSARYDWYQKDDFVYIFLFPRNPLSQLRDLIVECADGKSFTAKLLLKKTHFCINIDLHASISSLKVSFDGKKFTILLEKVDPTKVWPSLGSDRLNNKEIMQNIDRELVFHTCTIRSIDVVTYNTKLFTLNLPERVFFKSPIGYHVFVEGESSRRRYTVALPSLDDSSLPDEKPHEGCQLHLMIKMYPDGLITSELNCLVVGNTITISQPRGNFDPSVFSNYSRINLIAAGTGFTPMIRLISHLLNTDETDINPHVKLLFCNRHETDILWREHLDKLAAQQERFEVVYTLTSPEDSWDGLIGRIDRTMLTDFISYKPCDGSVSSVDASLSANPRKPSVTVLPTSKSPFFAICGPDEFSCSIKSMLLELKFPIADIYCFLA